MTARLISWPRNLGLSEFEWLNGPLAVSGSPNGSKISGRQPQVIASPFGWLSFRASYPELQGTLERRHRGLMMALHSGANAVRVKWQYGSTLTPAEAGYVGTFEGKTWSTGYTWSTGFNWAPALPHVTVASAAEINATEVILTDEFWGRSLEIGDIFGFFPLHLGWYFVTEVFSDGAYRIWPPLRKAITTDTFATLTPTAAFALTPGEKVTIRRGINTVEGAQATFDEIFDYDVRAEFIGEYRRPA